MILIQSSVGKIAMYIVYICIIVYICTVGVINVYMYSVYFINFTCTSDPFFSYTLSFPLAAMPLRCEALGPHLMASPGQR